MPYDVDLLMPTMQFTAEGSVPGAIHSTRVEIIINGVKYSPQTTVIATEKDRRLICSLYTTLKAAVKDVKVTIRYITYHKNGCKTTIHPAMIIACKHNSSSFISI